MNEYTQNKHPFSVQKIDEDFEFDMAQINQTNSNQKDIQEDNYASNNQINKDI